MGWDCTYREKGISSYEFFKRRMPDLLDLKVVNNVGYGVCIDEDNRGEAVVIVMEWHKDPHFNFEYKIMSEREGPFYYDCPKEIMDLLSPIKDFDWKGYAEEWRAKQRCNRTHKKPFTGNKMMYMGHITGDAIKGF